MRMRKKKNLLPRMERCAALQIKDPIAHRGHWRELMPEARELRVELGCGKGRFTAGTAAAEPDVLFVAVEMVPDAMVVAMERCAARGFGTSASSTRTRTSCPSFSLRARSTASTSTSATRGRRSATPSVA